MNDLSEKTYDEVYNSVLDRLKMIKGAFQGKVECISLTNDAIVNLERISIELADMIQDSSPLAKKTLEGFVVRYAEATTKIAVHHAILRISKQVEVEDTAYAKKIMVPVWIKLMAYLEMAIIPDDKERAIYTGRVLNALTVYKKILQTGKKGLIVKSQEWVRRQTLIGELRNQTVWGDCSENAASDYFKKFEKEPGQKNPKAWFECKKIGHAQYVRAIRDLVY
jgi:DNA replicative helicase MCM subunit Mcm2 (Cdc46/Mcm family)